MGKTQTKAKWLDEQIKKYRQRNAVLETIISAGGAPIKTTSIGRTQWDPRTCTCGVKGRTDRDHEPDCPVEPVVDSAPLIAATRELRLNDSEIASLLSLKEETQEPPDTSQLDKFVEDYERMAEDNHELRQELEHLRCRLAELTGVYDVTTVAPGRDLAALPLNGSQRHADRFSGGVGDQRFASSPVPPMGGN